jgi:hypothetical protein
MLTPVDTTRIADGMAAATLGYADATAAAYTQMLQFGFAMWGMALTGAAPADGRQPAQPVAMKVEPAFGHALDDWCGLPWLDTGRVTRWHHLMAEATPADAFMAWAGVVPLRGACTSWPVAKTMIDAGVPRAIAWPAAEANAAALDATLAAFAPIRRALTSATMSATTMPTVPTATMLAPAGPPAAPALALAAFQWPAAAVMFWTLATLTACRPATAARV